MKGIKEKAQELYNKMVVDMSIEKEQSKLCALVAVDFARENPLNTDGYNKYLDEVKHELENI